MACAMPPCEGHKHMSTTETAAADPVVALVAERFRLEEEAEVKSEPLHDDELAAILALANERIARVDDQIADTVATSAAGLIGQVRVLLELGCGTYGNDDSDHDHTCSVRLTDTIIAGIERLAGGGRIAAPFLRSIE
jgi:hypothetical protein